MTTLEKTVPVSAIRDGTVIDHIPSGKALKIVKLLDLSTDKLQVTLGLNLPSSRMKLKDLVKVDGLILTPDSASRVAILAPQATVSIIKNFEIENKFHVSLPDSIEGVIPCPNTLCISNHETVNHIILVKQRWKGNIRLQCHYCRKNFSQQDL